MKKRSPFVSKNHQHLTLWSAVDLPKAEAMFNDVKEELRAHQQYADAFIALSDYHASHILPKDPPDKKSPSNKKDFFWSTEDDIRLLSLSSNHRSACTETTRGSPLMAVH